MFTDADIGGDMFDDIDVAMDFSRAELKNGVRRWHTVESEWMEESVYAKLVEAKESGA